MTRRHFQPSAIVLSAVCAVGLLLAGYQYFLLQALHDAMKSQEALEISLSVMVESIPSLASESSKDIGVYLNGTAVIRRTVEQLADKIEYGRVIEGALWLVAIFLAASRLRRKGVAE